MAGSIHAAVKFNVCFVFIQLMILVIAFAMSQTKQTQIGLLMRIGETNNPFHQLIELIIQSLIQWRPAFTSLALAITEFI